MTLPKTQHNYIPASTEKAVNNVKKLEVALTKAPQVNIATHHILHGGMYARTIELAPDTLICGALIKVPTIIIIEGDALVYTNNGCKELKGYNVFAGSKNRKQAVLTLSDVKWTMVLKSDANTIEKAEEDFTDEFDNLFSRREGNDNFIVITRE
jgi:hypothetical protein